MGDADYYGTINFRVSQGQRSEYWELLARFVYNASALSKAVHTINDVSRSYSVTICGMALELFRVACYRMYARNVLLISRALSHARQWPLVAAFAIGQATQLNKMLFMNCSV